MHPNEALARREIDLIAAGDLEALEGLYSSDLIVHYPGRNPLSGTHPVQQFLAKFGALLGDGTLSRGFTMPSVPTITPCNFSTSRRQRAGVPIPGTRSQCCTCGTASSPNAGFTLTISTPWTSS